MATNTPTSPTVPPENVASADKLFKNVFELRLPDLVELVDPKLCARLDLADPRFLPRELFTDFRKMGHVEPDIAAEVRTTTGKPRLLVVHVETEGGFRETMDGRMMEYGWMTYLLTRKIVISIAVFLTGGQPGVVIREVELVDEGWCMNRFYYVAFSLSKCRAEDFVDLPLPLAPALAALMRSDTWDKVEHKLRCLEGISRFGDLALEESYALGKVVDKYLKLDENEEKRFTAELEREVNKGIYEMAVTWEEALAESRAEGEAKGEARGEARGKAQGQAEGLVKGTQKAILRMAETFWSTVPDEFVELIESTDDLDLLYEILERVPKVRSMEELGLGHQKPRK